MRFKTKHSETKHNLEPLLINQALLIIYALYINMLGTHFYYEPFTLAISDTFN